MKNFFSVAILLSSFSAMAVTDSLVVTLKARYYTENKGWKEIKLNTLNPKLKKAGLAQFPESVTLTKDSGKVWMKYVDLVEAANKKLKTELEILPDDNLTYGSTMCYLGTAAGVLKTIDGLIGTMIDDDMGIYGSRIGKKVSYTYPGEFLDDAERRADFEANVPAEVKEWDNYDTTSDSVLLATNYGPEGDGTELNLTLVKRCK